MIVTFDNQYQNVFVSFVSLYVILYRSASSFLWAAKRFTMFIEQFNFIHRNERINDIKSM